MPALGVVRILHFSHTDECAVISPCVLTGISLNAKDVEHLLVCLFVLRCTFGVRKIVHLKNLEAINTGMGKRVQYTYLTGELEAFREKPERKSLLKKPEKEDSEK